jgi:drug/metabolite transporter (DMT)-like permease
MQTSNLERPAAIRWFQILLLLALVIDVANNLAASGDLIANMAKRGVKVSPVSIAVMSLAPVLAGLGFWYFIARRRNNIARWALAVLVAVGALFFLLRATQLGWSNLGTPLAIAGLGELLKLAAVVCLFTPKANVWFSRSRPLSP